MSNVKYRSIRSSPVIDSFENFRGRVVNGHRRSTGHKERQQADENETVNVLHDWPANDTINTDRQFYYDDARGICFANTANEGHSIR